MKHRIVVVALIFVLARVVAGEEVALNYIDVHAHLWGHAFEGGIAGSGGRTDYEAAAKNLLDHMDRYGVATALLMPPPQPRDMADPDLVRELLAVAARHPQRLFVVAGGAELNPMIHECNPSKVTKEIRTKFESEVERLIGLGVKAFGEMTALHFSFSDRHPFLNVSPDHPLFLLLADVAAGHDVPIDLHMEAVSADMPMPKGFNKKNPDSMKANIPAFERLLAHNRRARIVWQHIGWDNAGGMTVELLRRLLQAHPNLYLALRVEERTFTMNRTPMPNRIVDSNRQIRPEWLELFSEFPDRFVIGSDEFFGIPGMSRRAPQSFEETWGILKQLSPKLGARIGRENAARIYNLK